MKKTQGLNQNPTFVLFWGNLSPFSGKLIYFSLQKTRNHFFVFRSKSFFFFETVF